MSKSALRSRIRRERRDLPPDRRLAETAAALAVAQPFLAGSWAGYMALGGELDLDGALSAAWAAGRAVLLPRVLPDGALAWAAIGAAGQCRVGSHGIREPDPAATAAVELPQGCPVLVPGVAFDRDGYRLGQGGGYYDRLLAARPDLRAIGIGFSCQLVEALPREAHDRPVAGLIIADRLLRDPRP